MINKEELKIEITAQELKGELSKTIEVIPPKTQEKECTPTEQLQEIIPDEEFTGLSKVNVNAIPEQYVVPSGTLEIIANGDYDVKLKENVNVNIGGTPKNLSEVVSACNVPWDDYCDYLNSKMADKPVYTEENVTLYTPNSNFTTYFISFDGTYYRIYWLNPENWYIDFNRQRLTGWYIMQNYDNEQIYTNNNREFYRYNDFTKTFSDNGYQREMYYKHSIPTLEEAINYLKSNETEYYHNTRTSVYLNGDDPTMFYSNQTFLIPENGEYNVCVIPRISNNETIETIS